MKKILIVTRSFYPENSPRSNRATELAKALSKMGHDVNIICPRVEAVHDRFEKDYSVTIKDLGKIRWKPIPMGGSGLVALIKRAARRLAKMAFVYPDIELVSLVRKALRHEHGYDLLISIAVPYPVHWGVAKARNQKHQIATTWVADCGDPFMGQENDTFRYPFYFKYVEKWFCRKADYLSVPTIGSIQGYYPEFRHKIKVIPQGFDFDEVLPTVKSVRKNARIAFAYAGIFIPGRRDPSEFLSYLIESNADFEFHIFTSTDALVKPFAARDNRNRIILHPVIPRLELLAHLKCMDFVVNFENAGSKQTPSKLVDYAIVKKPVLSVRTGQPNEVVIDEFLQGDFKNQYRISDPEQYKIQNVAEQFIALLGGK